MLLFLLATHGLIAQTTYLDFTGLTNTTPLTNVSLGNWYTFSASITLTESPSDPKVSSNGNISFNISSATSKQCLNLSFNWPAGVTVGHNNLHSDVLNTQDSMTFSDLFYTLNDPLSKIQMTNSSEAQYKPKAGITYYTNWSVDFMGDTAITICGLRKKGGNTGNMWVPVRIGVLTLPLPIELVMFEAAIINKNRVEINWKTATEINNDFFTIEKSQDARNWVFVDEIIGAGNSNTVNKYHGIDESPYQGTSYYRLKQTDFDGKHSYSDPVVVHNNGNEIIIYPNPVKDQLMVQIEDLPSSDVRLVDETGRSISLDPIHITEGFLYDVSNLKKGIYFIHTHSNTQTITQKVIIQ